MAVDFWRCKPWARDYLFFRPPPRKHMYRFVKRALVWPIKDVGPVEAMQFQCEKCGTEVFDYYPDRWGNIGSH